MRSLTVSDLNNIISTKSDNRKQSFQKILEMMFSRIEKAAELSQLCCFFEVPEFVLGYPIYDINDCIKYIIAKLNKNGFLIKYFFPRILYISWNIDEIKQVQIVNRLNDVKKQTKQLQNMPKTPLGRFLDQLPPPPPTQTVSQSQSQIPNMQQTHQQPKYMMLQHHQPLAIEGNLPVSHIQQDQTKTQPSNNIKSVVANKTTKTNQPKTKQHRVKFHSQSIQQSKKFIKSISEFKPSGKFVLDLQELEKDA